ncbi:MAG: gamma-glutamyltransferase [Gammaproteobacteria bacterium]|nr:gamma-glutamyltransferase [Gammaproteobacteria bacterium]
MSANGLCAAGHPETAEAACAILRAGGNAFDAVVAANLAATVAEPVLCSLGGGGFMVARVARDGSNRCYDFFTQTPRRAPSDAIDFHPVTVDFGSTTQDFHIGLGAAATPGMVKGLFHIHRELGRLPMGEVVAPAVALARDGVRMNALQAYIHQVVSPIYLASPEAARLFASPGQPGRLAVEGEVLRFPELADTLETLAIEQEDLFYRGEIGQAIAAACATGGGCLTLEDLAAYRVAERRPLFFRLDGARVFINPPPSCGGMLIAFAADLLAQIPSAGGPDDGTELTALATAMALTNKARMDALAAGRSGPDARDYLFDSRRLARYRAEILGRGHAPRGTTHISVADAAGNIASMTVSNGEGCGYVVPGTGIMLNNMLGEEDLNPRGFHRWQPDERLSSMMAPALVYERDGSIHALGSGGSNRIRSAMLQVMLNIVRHRLPLAPAIERPRIHYENGVLNVEDGFPEAAIAALGEAFDDVRVWPTRNLYFGGAHGVSFHGADGRMSGAGDPRRGGVCLPA